MSIYATMYSFHISEEGSCDAWNPGEEECDCVEVYVQGVPDHIDYTGDIWDDWLPSVAETHKGWRAVFVCGPETRKGTDRNGQEYVNALVVVGGKEWAEIGFNDLMGRIASAISSANRPSNLRREIRDLKAQLAQSEQGA